MRFYGYFKLVPAIIITTSCTFGEGPELLLADSDDATNIEGVFYEPVTVVDTLVQTNDTETNVDNTQPSGGDNSSSSSQQNDGESIVANVQPVEEAVNSAQEDQTVSEEQEQVPVPDNIIRIPRTDRANAPIINGDTIDYLAGTQLLGGEWRFAAQLNGAGEALGINSLMLRDADQGSSDSFHHWAAMHDGEYLYVVVISDDNGLNSYDTNELRKPWKDDSVEIFFDGNNSQLNEYDGVDDFHFTVNLRTAEGVSNANGIANSQILQSALSAPLPSDLFFSAGPKKGPQPLDTSRVRKDIYEFRIKLSELNIQIDQPFGFEVQLNDDDDNGSRDAKWGWSHPQGLDASNDNTWQDPSFMGTAILVR